MLRNVVAIVSGGSSGLGAATASYIVRNGGRVVVADLPSSKDHFLRLAAASCAEVHLPIHDNITSTDNRNEVDDITEEVTCDVRGYHPYDGKDDHNSKRRWSGPLMAFAETDVRNEDDVGKALDLAEEKFGIPGKNKTYGLLTPPLCIIYHRPQTYQSYFFNHEKSKCCSKLCRNLSCTSNNIQ